MTPRQIEELLAADNEELTRIQKLLTDAAGRGDKDAVKRLVEEKQKLWDSMKMKLEALKEERDE